jgi:phospholipase/lecithinase/hemolysin
VQSVVTQVSLFEKYLAPKPAGTRWASNNTLFAVWIGINDVGNSYYWTNVTQAAFHKTLMTRLFGQVETLYNSGGTTALPTYPLSVRSHRPIARNFLFLTVPPTNRAPLLIESGPAAVASITASLADYNAQLAQSLKSFQASHRDLGQVVLYDTRPVFNTLLDNNATFGFVNATGYCEAYENGTPSQTTQVAGCAPVSSYFWLNSLHPLFTVHECVSRFSRLCKRLRADRAMKHPC